MDDRRTLALALALDSALAEVREALVHELLDPRVVVATVLWMAGLYLAMWVVPEPTTKVVTAVLTVALVGWLGLDTLHGLWDGWARLATQAHRARTFEELQAAGNQYAKLMGRHTARTLVMVVMAGMGSTAASVAKQVRALPGYVQAAAQAEVQGVRMVVLEEVRAAAGSTNGRLVVMMNGRRGATGARATAAEVSPKPTAAPAAELPPGKAGQNVWQTAPSRGGGNAANGTANGERAGKRFTPRGKREIIDANRQANGGKTVCEHCGAQTVPAQQSQRGVTPSPNETHVDHVIPRSKGGDGAPSNGQTLCRGCNLDKGDNWP